MKSWKRGAFFEVWRVRVYEKTANGFGED